MAASGQTSKSADEPGKESPGLTEAHRSEIATMITEALAMQRPVDVGAPGDGGDDSPGMHLTIRDIEAAQEAATRRAVASLKKEQRAAEHDEEHKAITEAASHHPSPPSKLFRMLFGDQ